MEDESVFLVRFRDRPAVPEEIKSTYLKAIKGDWGYASVTSFLNTIAKGVVDGKILIIRLDRDIISKLLKRVKEKNYCTVEDWFKDRIRDELNG